MTAKAGSETEATWPHLRETVGRGGEIFNGFKASLVLLLYAAPPQRETVTGRATNVQQR